MRLRALGSGLVVAAVVMFPGALQGQVSLGAGGGLAFTSLTGDDDSDDLETKTGFYVGGSLGVPLGGILGFGTGAYYVQKGAKATEGDASFDLTFLEVPALLQVQVTEPERPVGVGLFLGPSFSFNLSCEDLDGDCGDDARSFELGAMFGGGLSFAAGQSATVSVNGGLDLGLTTAVDGSEDDSDLKNQAYFLGVGISFPMGG